MKRIETDVDVDVFGREDILRGIECIYGRIDRADGSHEKHNTGVYFQNIPRDPVANMATLDHRIARDYGYFKIDFLNVNMYEGVKSEKHLFELIEKEPPWDFFQYEEITDKLFHLKGHSNLLVEYKPKSIEDLAMVLAIMRPGKAHLQHQSWDNIRKDVWIKGDDAYQFKRPHGIAYAIAIVVHLNLLIETLSND